MNRAALYWSRHCINGATTAEKSPLPFECYSCKNIFLQLGQKLKAFMTLAQSLGL